MNFGDAVNRLAKLTEDNSPLILTSVGIVGTVVTAYLTGRASFKAAQILDDQETLAIQEDLPPLEPKEKAKLVWKLYIPATSSAIFTIAAITLANRIGTRRAAALAAAYVVSEKAFDEYREKIVEKLGSKKEKEARVEMAQDRVNRQPPPSTAVVLAGEGSVMCMENFTGRYWLCDMETLRAAQNSINAQILSDSYASLSDFYRQVGLSSTGSSDEFGWDVDRLLELSFSAVLAPATNKPVMVVDYRIIPVRDFYKSY